MFSVVGKSLNDSFRWVLCSYIAKLCLSSFAHALLNRFDSLSTRSQPESIRTDIRIEYKVSVHDRKLRCQWGVPAEHSVRFDIHYRRRLVRANIQSCRRQERKQKKISIKTFFFLFSAQSSPKYENYLPSQPSACFLFHPCQRYKSTFTFTEISVHVRLLFVECVIWIFIRAHARQMIQNLIKKLFTSNHLKRKSSETFVIEHSYGSGCVSVRIKSLLCGAIPWMETDHIGRD